MEMIERLSSAARQVMRVLAAGTFPLHEEGLVFHCPLTASRRKNLAIGMASQHLLHYGEPALPHILHVGVTTMCNLRCPACPTGNGTLGRPAEHLSFDIYSRTVDELRDVLMLQIFWDWGEPLMHPRFPDMIDYASRSGIMTAVSTNGTVANSEKQIDRLVAARPSVVMVCVDGADQQTHETYRAGAKLSKVLDTIRRLRDAKDRQGTLYPLIEFRTLAIRENEHQMPELLRMATDYGADLLNVKSLRPFDYRGTNVDSKLVPLGPSMSRYSYDQAARDAARRLEVGASGPLRCGKPHRSPTLNSDGTLVFCGYSEYADEKFGKIGEEGFRHLWRSRRSREIRRRFARRGGTETCDTCYFRSDHPPTILHQVPLRELPQDISVAWPKTPDEFLAACSFAARC